MFYKKGIDITNDKQMFNFLKSHFTYDTLNSWNHSRSIANNVKLYKLNLSGDWCVAYDLLCSDEYFTINQMIAEWNYAHKGYCVGFNGRSDGYLVLYRADSNRSILPEEIDESEDYDEYKRYCREFYGSVKANRSDLVYYTKLVQDFDRLCDELREYCDELSKMQFEVITMQKAVDDFNEMYYDDLCYLEFDSLVCDSEGKVDCSEICKLDCLKEAFFKLADRTNLGYKLMQTSNHHFFLMANR